MDLIKNNLLIYFNLKNLMGHGAGSECMGEWHEHVFESNQLCNVRSCADELVWLCGQGLNGNYYEPSPTNKGIRGSVLRSRVPQN